MPNKFHVTLKEPLARVIQIGDFPALSDKTSSNTQELLMLPLDNLKLWSTLRKDKMPNKDMLEILNQNMRPAKIDEINHINAKGERDCG